MRSTYFLPRSVFCLLLASFPALSTALITPSQTDVTVQKGQTVTIDTSVSNIDDLYAFQFDLDFNSTILKEVSISEGPLLKSGGPTFFLPGAVSNSAGTITGIADTLIGSVPGVDGSGILAEITFSGLATGSSPISLGNEVLLDSNLNKIDSVAPEPSSFGLALAAVTLVYCFSRLRTVSLQLSWITRIPIKASVLLAMFLFGSGLLVTRANAQSPPFAQCPAAGLDTSCRILILIDTNGSLRVLTDQNVSPTYDGSDDTLVGVLNLSANKVASIPLHGPNPIFAFDGDGICSASISPNPPGCPYGPTGYEGPGVSYTNVSADYTSGVVNFSPPLAAKGGSTYFGLEEAIQTQCSAFTPPTVLKQDNPAWAGKTLGPPATSTTTIGAYGCFLTDLAMEVNYYSQMQGSGFQTDPVKLNAYLVANGGFDSQPLAGIYFSKLPLVAKYAASNGVSLSYKGIVDHRDDFTLDQYLCNGQPPMLMVGSPHWVVATGQATVGTTNTYSDIDPDSWPNGSTLQGWNYTYSQMALFSDSPGSLAGLYVTAHSPLELLLTDPNGAQTGFNPATNVRFESIPASNYSINQLADDETHGPPLTPELKELGVVGAIPGKYGLQLFGVSNGSYTIDITYYDVTGNVGTKSFTGITSPGVVSNVSVGYSDSPPGSATITTYCAGDVNGDGVVNSSDLAAVEAAFGSSSGGAKYKSAADVNHDGKIDILDLAFVSRQTGCQTTVQ